MAEIPPDGSFDDVERLLRRLAPEPAFEFVWAVERRLRGEPEQPVLHRASRMRRPHRRTRLAFAAALTVALLAGLGATGGLSYAAYSIGQVTSIVHRASVPQRAIVVRGLSSGGDQYRPGYGFGDPDHNHTGPPGLTRMDADGQRLVAPPPIPTAPAPGGLAKLVAAYVNFDEQAHLWISVVDPHGRPLLLTQHSRRGGSKVGDRLLGPQTKFIQYALLVPRTLWIQLRVPENLLRKGVVYRIRIVAIDPQGNRSRIFIRFREPKA